MQPQLNTADTTDSEITESDAFRIYDATPNQGIGRPSRTAKPTPAKPTAGSWPPRLRLVESAAELLPNPSIEAIVPHTRQPATAPRERFALRLDAEAELLEILTTAPATGETIEASYRRKEHDLTQVFARLSPPEARTLHRRLSEARPDDAVAGPFGRMVEARRTRLLAFLGGARRREAVAIARR